MTLQLALRCNCGGSQDFNVAGHLDRVYDVGTGQDISHQVPITQAVSLHDAARTGAEIDVDLFLLREGHPYLDHSRQRVAMQTVRAVVWCD